MSDIVQSSFINRGSEIHYWKRDGSGDSHVLFFHGAGLDHRMFEAQFEALDGSYTLVAWDARGHGQSKLFAGQRFNFDDLLSDVQELYKMLGIESAVIVGQSMGGNLAQGIAYEYPDTVEKLVLIGCTNNAGVLSRIERLSLTMAGPLLHCMPWATLVNQVVKVISIREDVRAYARECFELIGKKTFIDAFVSLAASLKPDPDYRLPVPTLLIVGAKDTSGNILKIANSWAESDDNITAHIIENAAHNTNQDQPEIVNTLIEEFLRT